MYIYKKKKKACNKIGSWQHWQVTAVSRKRSVRQTQAEAKTAWIVGTKVIGTN